jgi:hypothetical protein
MASEHPVDAKVHPDSNNEKTAVDSVSTATTNLDAALSKLNVSNAFGRMKESSVDTTSEYFSNESAGFNSRGKKVETAKAKSDLRDEQTKTVPIGEAVARPAETTGPKVGEKVNFNSREKAGEIVAPSAALTASADIKGPPQTSETPARGTKRNPDKDREPSRRETASLGSDSERAKIVAVKGTPTKASADGHPYAGEAPSDSSLSSVAADEFGRLIKQHAAIGYEHSSLTPPNIDSVTKVTEIAPIGMATPDYHSAILEIINSVTDNPPQLRRLVYELARANFAKQTWQKDSVLTPKDVKECVLALEMAIARVEVGLGEREHISIPRLDSRPQRFDEGSAQHTIPAAWPRRITNNPSASVGAAPVVQLASNWPKAAQSPQHPTWPHPAVSSPHRGMSSVPAERPTIELVYPERDNSDAVRARRRIWLWFIVWPCIQLIGPAIFCVALYMAAAGRLDLQSAPTRQAGVAEPQQLPPVEGARPSGLPLPSAYGIYAISRGQLSELQPLPVRAPDPRVQLSAEINKPSSSVLPDGKVVFVLFRRELLNNAPQKVAIRVVARVASSVTFSAGKAATAKPDASWHIRSNSYDFQVSPTNENREMVLVRPTHVDFTLPSGRYALVYGGLAYDFTVDGPVTDPAQCLESFEAVSGPVFTECRPK